MLERNLRVLEFFKIRDMLATHAVSDMGRERCLALEPAGTLADVIALQEETEEAGIVISYTGGDPMPFFADVRAQLKRAGVGATLGAKALLDVAEALRAARVARDALVTDRENTPRITGMASGLFANRPLEEEIFDAILSEDEISDHASPELYAIRRHIRLLNDKMRDKLNSFIHSPATAKYLQDALITVRNGRYVIPVKAECRPFVPGLIHDQSSTGATLFIEPMSVVEAGNDLKQWTAKEAQEIERILSALTARITPDAPAYAGNLDILALLDAIFAKALLAREMRGVMPKLNGEGRINIISGRHPLIDPDKVVPMNLWMGEDFRCLVVTGPNTGGKTVTLKTVGLLTLMTQAGLQPPCALGTELAVFDEVFADIGDEQSIEQSLSTFSSHMTNIVAILGAVTTKSLALFDELGAGTDPTEGAALAISVLDHLREAGITCLATTHYSELKAYALSTRGIENASVEFDVETLRPTYRLSIGVPGKSNAFEISKKLGLPQALIDDANARLSKDQIAFEDVIANAEYHRKVAEKERQLAERAHRETQELRDEAEKLARQLESQRGEMLKKAREEARTIVARAQRESEQVISELKKSRSKDGVALKEHELNQLRGKLQGTLDDFGEALATPVTRAVEPLKDLKIGETVELMQLNTKGTVLGQPDAKGEVPVQAGIMKLKVHISQLRRAEPDKKARRDTSTVALAPRAASLETDVRGMSLEEAIQAVDLYIDGCVLQGLKSVQIIHGKGTGILRSGIQAHLKKHPSVAEFRLGKFGEGEDGVTVVTLK